MLDAIRRSHARWVMSRRTRVLAEYIATVLPERGRVLDVGAGDGQIDALLMDARRGLEIEGVDILVRKDSRIPVSPFDGKLLPFPDRSYDWVLFVDTLHHAGDPEALLSEGSRVSRNGVVIKDHVCENAIDHVTLGCMDWVGNRPHGVPIPYDYRSEASWRDLFRDLGLRIDVWNGRLSLYPWPAGFLLNRSLHFLAKLSNAQDVPARGSLEEGSRGDRRVLQPGPIRQG